MLYYNYIVNELMVLFTVNSFCFYMIIFIFIDVNYFYINEKSVNDGISN